ncbi:SapC family protein [Acidimangrovimonas sediminis]|uniref:SapC family protein n=1 Tax=Acidimangrovimonas sediminis TaxID=2056283 RepID=UPI000C80BFB4|nr:SapC family protein [Acidimangrovimonas sediminis]
MSNPLFYGAVVALDRNAHAGLRLKVEGPRFGFARGAHLVPALAEEFETASADLPIAFLPGTKRPSPVFVAGLTPGRSLMVTEEGAWRGRYVPAYLRRYPFIIGETAGEGDATQALLCIDDSFAGLHEKGGAALFAEDGQPSQATQEALALSEGYRRGALQTDAFCDRLQELNLLNSVTLDIKRADGSSSSVHGLLTIDRAAFDALPDEVFLSLRKAGYLAPIYAHFHSLGALEQLSARLGVEAA